MAEMELSGSNVLRYDLADNTAVIVRPSGTEPKVKVYILASGDTRAECDDKISKYSKWAEALAG
jgi:phosphoglucomutase